LASPQEEINLGRGQRPIAIGPARATVYEFGPYRLDPGARTLERDGVGVALPPKAIDVLLELIQRRGALAAKEDLMHAVWQDAVIEDGNLNQMVFLLRRALGEGYIDTVPRRGYRFTPAVHTSELPLRIDSVAVLPLANLSGDPAQDFFADGVTEALITELARLRGLRVVSRNSAMRYRRTQETVAQIARALHVRAIIAGSITRRDNQLRITAQLLHAVNEQQLWGESYEAPLERVLELQQGISRDIAIALRGQLSSDEQALFHAPRRARPEAHALYLKGRYLARQLTAEAQQRALTYFRESIEADPEYPSPYAGLADCYVQMAYFFGMEPKKAFAEAQAPALRAVQLDDGLAEGHAVLSVLRLLNDWDWAGADRESRLAIELAPGDANVYWKRGIYLRYAGRADEAVAAHRHAESLDPLSLIAIQEVGWPLYYARRFGEAAEQFRKAVELESQWDQLYFGLGLALVNMGRYEEAVSALRTAVRLGPDNPLNQALLVCVLGRAGREREARQHLGALEATGAYVPHWFRSFVWLGLGEPERAFAELDAAFRDHEPCLVSLKVDAMFDPIRADPRFAAMVRRVGLEP
jgi:adenylate cyclase